MTQAFQAALAALPSSDLPPLAREQLAATMRTISGQFQNRTPDDVARREVLLLGPDGKSVWSLKVDAAGALSTVKIAG
jgi:hypothetical protein